MKRDDDRPLVERQADRIEALERGISKLVNIKLAQQDELKKLKAQLGELSAVKTRNEELEQENASLRKENGGLRNAVSKLADDKRGLKHKLQDANRFRTNTQRVVKQIKEYLKDFDFENS